MLFSKFEDMTITVVQEDGSKQELLQQSKLRSSADDALHTLCSAKLTGHSSGMLQSSSILMPCAACAKELIWHTTVAGALATLLTHT